jgi:hypothetical protein
VSPESDPESVLGSGPKKEEYGSQEMLPRRSHHHIERGRSLSQPGYDRWKKEYGGLDKTQAKKLKELEKENLELKKLVADLSLDNAILKRVLGKK